MAITTGPIPAWSDDPIRRLEDDELDRVGFARQTAHLIISGHALDRSTVYGLTGQWGSGKSSLIQMVEQVISAEDINWKITHFTPWAAADAESLIAEFFRTISEILPESEESPARTVFRRYARLAAPMLKAIPVVGSGAEGVAKEALDRYYKQKPWQQQFDELSAELSALNIPVLVIVDDIDRLHSDELLSLFKTVRLLGRFPGVDYLLAYDEESILLTLTGSDLVRNDPVRALRYLEKIVQYPLAIPPVQATHIDRMFTKGLSRVLGAKWPITNSDDKMRLDGAYEACMRRGLRTVRGVQRYVSQAGQYLPLVSEEVNVVDYLLLTYVRLHYPRVYERLPSYKSMLLGTGLFGPFERLTADQKRTRVNDWLNDVLLADVDRESLPPLTILLRHLFPALADVADNYLDYVGSGSQFGSGMRVCDNSYFDRYFVFGIPMDDVSDFMIATTLQEIAGEVPGAAAAKARETVLQLNSTSARAIEKLRRYSRQFPSSGADSILAFALGLMKSINNVDELIGGHTRGLVLWVADLVVARPTAVGGIMGAVWETQLPPRVSMQITVKVLAHRRKGADRDDTDKNFPTDMDFDDVKRSAAGVAMDAMAEILHADPRNDRDLKFWLSAVNYLASPDMVADWLVKIVNSGQLSLITVGAAFVRTGITLGSPDTAILDMSQGFQTAVNRLIVVDADHVVGPAPSTPIDMEDTSWEGRIKFVEWWLANRREGRSTSP